MAWSLVQQSATQTSSSLTLDLPGATTQGNLILATVGAGSATALTAAAGCVTVASIGNSTNESYIFAYYNNPGGISSLTFGGGAGSCIGELSEWNCAGISTVAGPSDTGTNTAGAVSSVAVNTQGTSLTGDLVIAIGLEHLTTASAITWTNPSGFTEFSSLNVGSSANHLFAAYAVSATTAGVQTVTITSSVAATGAAGWTGVVATFSLPTGPTSPMYSMASMP
jgi:hypothetical protein